MSVLRICVLLSLVLALGGCGHNDNDVRATVRAQLAVDPETAPANIEVTVSNGVATLTGDTRSHAQQDRAIIVARAVKGVKEVRNQMKIGDAGIEDAIRQAVAADPMVARIPLRVVVRDGVATLSSDQTNKDERTRLVSLARPIEGVKNVVDDMR